MRRLKYILFLLVFCFLVGCSNNASQDIQYYVTILSDYDYVRVGEELELSASSNYSGEFEWIVDDENVAIVDENGYLTGKSFGDVVVTVKAIEDETIINTINISVLDGVVSNVKVVGVTYGSVGDVLSLKFNLEPKEVKSKYSIKSLNEEIATVNKDKTITLNKLGFAKIQVIIDDEGKYVHEFEVGCCDYSKILVDAKLNNETFCDGQKVIYNDITYYYGYTAFNSINKASRTLKDNAILTILEGTYNEDNTIKSSNVTMIGVNNPVLEGTTILTTGVSNITIEGITYHGDAGILLYGENNNILIQNNKFLSNYTDLIWKNNLSNGSIRFYPSVKSYDNISITGNTFKDLNVPAINISNMNNIKITKNEFKQVTLDCIRFNQEEATKSSQWLIKENTFFECYNGIYTKELGTKIISYDIIFTITNNTFSTITNNVIYLDGNNSGTISLDIRHNDFYYSNDYIYIDTVDEQNEEPKLHGFVNYNNFYGKVPHSYLLTSSEANTIDFKNNYFATDTKSCATYKIIKLSDNPSTISSNVIIDNGLSDCVDNTNLKQILFGKSALYTDQETSFSCEEATSYQVNDKTVLTIDSKGNISPIKEGKVTISAYKNSTLLDKFDVVVYGALQLDYATKLLEVAFGEEGYVEGNNNYTKYGVWYSEQVNDKSFAYGAWCAMYVSWCANQAGIPTSIIPLYASCTAGRSWFESRGLFQYKENYRPKAGDIIFFLSNGAGHTGIVISCVGDTVYTIEGNTSNMCAKRSYNWNYKTITGYGTPNYPPYTGKTTITFDVSDATDGSNLSTR